MIIIEMTAIEEHLFALIEDLDFHGGQPIYAVKNIFLLFVLRSGIDPGISVGKCLNNYYKIFMLNAIWLRGGCPFSFAAL